MGRLLNPGNCRRDWQVSKRAILTDFEQDQPVCAQSLNSASLRATAAFFSVTYLGSPLLNGG